MSLQLTDTPGSKMNKKATALNLTRFKCLPTTRA